MRYRFAAVVSLLILSGCDPFYGVESRTKFPGPVNIDCVRTTISSVPEAGHITYQRSASRSTELLPKQREVLTIMNLWLYGEGEKSFLQINQTPDGWEYTNSRTRMGVPVPHEEMARFVPLMQKVNQALQTRCGLPVGHLRAEFIGETKTNEP